MAAKFSNCWWGANQKLERGFELARFNTTPCFKTLGYSCVTVFYNPMFPYVAAAKDKQFQPGPYEGVELLVLHKNETTGGMTVLRKFKAGTYVPAHTHPETNEHVYILSGEWKEGEEVYGPGTFLFAPRGHKHGPHLAQTEVISVTTFDGPLTIV